MRKLAAPLILVVLALGACGGDDEKPSDSSRSAGPAGGIAGAQTTETTASETTATESAETSTPSSSPDDEEAVRDTVVTWLLEGRCEAMSDRFLEMQAFGGDTREERCDLFRKVFQKPQYSEDDIVVSDVQVSGDEASLTIGDKISNIESEYQLIRTGGGWQINSADIK